MFKNPLLLLVVYKCNHYLKLISWWAKETLNKASNLNKMQYLNYNNSIMDYTSLWSVLQSLV